MTLDYWKAVTESHGGVRPGAPSSKEEIQAMNVKISPSGDVWSDSVAAHPPPDSTSSAESAAHGRGPDDAVQVDAIPAVPPAEVMDAISVASQAPDRLAADGKELRFELDPPTGKVRVQVQDLQGNVIGEVRPSTALDVAEGADLD